MCQTMATSQSSQGVDPNPFALHIDMAFGPLSIENFFFWADLVFGFVGASGAPRYLFRILGWDLSTQTQFLTVVQ